MRAKDRADYIAVLVTTVLLVAFVLVVEVLKSSF